MKENIISRKRLVALLMALILLLSLGACGEKSTGASSGPEGTFYNTQRDEDDGKGFQPTDEYLNFGYMTFKSDGSGKWEYALETDIEWKLKGDKLTIVEKWKDVEHGDQEETYKGTWDGEKVTVDVWGYNYLFEKTDDAPSSSGPEEPAPSQGAQSALVGFYEGTGSDMQGTKLDPAGEWLELMEDGRGKWFLGATEDTFAWSLDGSEIHFDVDVANSDIKMAYTASLEGDKITLDTGMLYFFSKSGSPPAASSGSPIVTSSGTSKASSGKKSTEGIQPSGGIKVPSDWYGVFIITDSYGFELGDGQYDVWGSFDKDTSGPAYFELFLMADPKGPDDPEGPDYPVLSMYIDEEEKTWLTPIIGADDAWIMEQDLSEDDEWSLLTMYDKGALDIYYTCDDGSRYAVCRFFIREYGTTWNEQIDPLPPSYADYVGEL